MKKILLVLSLILTTTLVGCSSGDGYKKVSVSKIDKAIEKSNLLVEQHTSSDIIDSDFFNDIEENIDEGFIIKAESNMALEDIIVIKADDEDINAAYDALKSYEKYIIRGTFGEDSANSTIVEKKGNYTYLVSAKNAAKIEETILNVIKK